MKQVIPFTKDITFKTKIGELTSISLDNDLELKGEDLITGNFYIKGSYKMLRTSELEEEYNYKLPCEIAISNEYDTFDAIIDIDDFNYEIINDDTLKVNIAVVIDNLEKKDISEIYDEERIEEPASPVVDDLDFIEEELNISFDEENERDVNPLEILSETKPEILNLGNAEETYKTYCVYLFKEEDTVEKVMDEFNVTLADLTDYNDMDNITIGTKLIIPASKND